MIRSWSSPNRLLEQLSTVPELTARYKNCRSIRSVTDLQSLPQMDEAVYNLAMQYWLTTSSGNSDRYLFMSSGSTGEPKFSLLPSHLFIDDIAKAWRPLVIDSSSTPLLLDFTTSGKAWSAAHFYRELCLREGFTYVHVGPVMDFGEMERTWAAFMRFTSIGVLAGHATQLSFLANYFNERFEKLLHIRSILWTAEPLRPYQEAALSQAFPNAEFWGVYGGTESWVIGYQTPDMLRDEFFVFDHQLVEASDDALLVTSLHEDVINPILRYRISDHVVVLGVGADGIANRIKVGGRSDGQIIIDGNKIAPEVLRRAINGLAGVADSQIIFHEAASVISSIEIRLVQDKERSPVLMDTIREAILTADLQNEVLLSRLTINWSAPMILNPRTGKCRTWLIQSSENNQVNNPHSPLNHEAARTEHSPPLSRCG